MKRSIIQFRKRRAKKGFMLVELAIAMALLVGISVISLMATMNVLRERQWVLTQALADSRMTIEVAKAQRVPFVEMKGAVVASSTPGSVMAEDFRWPMDQPIEKSIELGVLPGGRAVTGLLKRQRFADQNNYPNANGVGTLATNPLGIERWKLVVTLTYEINGRQYVKTRTVVRSR